MQAFYEEGIRKHNKGVYNQTSINAANAQAKEDAIDAALEKFHKEDQNKYLKGMKKKRTKPHSVGGKNEAARVELMKQLNKENPKNKINIKEIKKAQRKNDKEENEKRKLERTVTNKVRKEWAAIVKLRIKWRKIYVTYYKKYLQINRLFGVVENMNRFFWLRYYSLDKARLMVVKFNHVYTNGFKHCPAEVKELIDVLKGMYEVFVEEKMKWLIPRMKLMKETVLLKTGKDPVEEAEQKTLDSGRAFNTTTKWQVIRQLAKRSNMMLKKFKHGLSYLKTKKVRQIYQRIPNNEVDKLSLFIAKSFDKTRQTKEIKQKGVWELNLMVMSSNLPKIRSMLEEKKDIIEAKRAFVKDAVRRRVNEQLIKEGKPPLDKEDAENEFDQSMADYVNNDTVNETNVEAVDPLEHFLVDAFQDDVYNKKPTEEVKETEKTDDNIIHVNNPPPLKPSDLQNDAIVGLLALVQNNIPVPIELAKEVGTQALLDLKNTTVRKSTRLATKNKQREEKEDKEPPKKKKKK